MALVARLYLQGFSQRQIAERLNSRRGITHKVTHVAVHNDIKKAQELWLASAIVDIDAFKAAQLAKLDLIEAEAWEAWEKSKGTKVTTTKRLDPDKNYTPAQLNQPDEIKSENTPGDIRFLNLAMDCVLKRNKVMGLDTLNININEQDKGNENEAGGQTNVPLEAIRDTIGKLDKEALIQLVHGSPSDLDYIDFEELENGTANEEE